MHILVTDVVTCPRCGPGFGLIVLADRMEERHVMQGSLGCANCREQFPVRGGIADLRWGEEGEAPQARPHESTEAPENEDPERALRMAALLGITGPAGPVVIVTGETKVVEEVQGHLPDAGVVGMSAVAPERAGDAAMGWLLSGSRIPVRSRSLGGVVLAGGDPLPLLEDALRCLSRGARVVMHPAPAETVAKLLAEGAELLLEQEQVAVAFDPRAG